MIRQRYHLCSLVASTFALLAANTCPAQTTIAPGDKVVIVTPGTSFGIRNQPMTPLSPGQQLHVTEVRGKWIGGYVVGDPQQRLGWVSISEVGTIEPATRLAPTIPDVADDTAAVAALRKLGAKLQLDDEGRTQTIAADGGQLRDDDMAQLAGVPHLLSLDLTGQPISDEGLKHVARCVGLQKLYLSQTNVTDAGLAQLRSLEWLEVLAVAQTSVSGAGLAELQPLRNLHVLNMGYCHVTDEDMRHIASMPSIEVLALPHTEITDSGLVHLRPLAKLRVLNLDGTKVTGSGFDNLLNLRELRMLYIRHCKVEAEHIEKLDSELPGLAIYD